MSSGNLLLSTMILLTVQLGASELGVIYNYDGDLTYNSFDAELNRRGIDYLFDSLTGTPVGTVTYSLASGTEIMNYPSRVASTWGWRKTPDLENEKIAVRVEKARKLIDSGEDMYRYAAESCRERGMKFIPSLRINDWHFVGAPEKSFLCGKFALEHLGDYSIGAGGGSSPLAGYPEAKNLPDFARQEVRDFRLAQIAEALERYGDVSDGFELDFSRSYVFFAAGRAKENAPLLTDFVRRVRELVDAESTKQGRAFTLIARVPPTVRSCHFSGIEIEKWVEEKLVDVIVPSLLMTLYNDMPVEEFVRLAGPSGVRVYAGLYPRSGNWRWPFSTASRAENYRRPPVGEADLPLICGALANYWGQGADGIYAYNFGVPRNADDYAVLRAMGSLHALNGLPKDFALTPDYWLESENTFLPSKALPCEIESGKPVHFTLPAYEDPRSSRAKLLFRGFRLGFAGVSPESKMELKLNGITVFKGALSVGGVATSGRPSRQRAHAPAPEFYWQRVLPARAVLTGGEEKIELTLVTPDGSPATLCELILAFRYENSTAYLYRDE